MVDERERGAPSPFDEAKQLTPNFRVIEPAAGETSEAEKLVDQLALDLENAGSLEAEAPVIVSREAMMALGKEVDALIAGHDSEFQLEYHNGRHSRKVWGRLLELLAEHPILPEESQILAITTRLHDYGNRGLGRPRADGLTNEEHTSLPVDQLLKKYGYSLKQRVIARGLLIATTFFNDAIQPSTDLEKLLAIADVGSFKDPWEDWIAESALVLREFPEEKRPASAEAWLEDQQNFLVRVRGRMIPVAERLWGQALAEKESLVASLRENFNNSDLAAARESIQRHIVPHLRKSALLA